MVDRARKHGVSVRHDYEEEEAAIPLPATMSILLGNQITSETGGSVRLFSDYPFPWRAKKRQGLDAFEEMRFIAFGSYPTARFIPLRNIKGGPPFGMPPLTACVQAACNATINTRTVQNEIGKLGTCGVCWK